MVLAISCTETLSLWPWKGETKKKAKYLQVNALSERIIRIYLHEFTNNERENSIPHEAANQKIRICTVYEKQVNSCGKCVCVKTSVHGIISLVSVGHYEIVR